MSKSLKSHKKETKIKRNGKFKYYTGILNVNSRGNAYFVCRNFKNDIFIHSSNLNKGLDGDTVKVCVYKKRKNFRKEGEVLEIIRRFKTHFVGILKLKANNNFGIVIADNDKMYVDIFVSKDKLNGAKDRDKVVVNLLDWSENSKNPFGEINSVLGRSGEHNTEIQSILADYGLMYEFSKDVKKELKNLDNSITLEEISKRKDISKEFTLTIDPEDAKDFDDALSHKILENGNYEIGIHIADVSHYVSLNSNLEKEAYKRSTSIYLVDKVISMLPEKISNEVCSLNPNEEKLTFSAIFELNKKAQILKEWYGKTVICSNHRFSYEEAQFIIGNGKLDKEINIPENISITNTSYKVCKNIVNAVLNMNELAKIMRKKRLENGAITFEKLETKFDIDEKSNPKNIYFKEFKDSNKLIEEFMLLANRKVSEFISKKNGKKSKNTFVYRVHEEPDKEKLIDLQKIINKFGYRINLKSKKSISNSLNKLLENIHGKEEANMIETLIIRSMKKAEYTTKNIGHYGLSFEYYSHFTSPIRRYPDIMVHRLLEHYLKGGKSPKNNNYEKKCKHASEMEYLVKKAERDFIKYMQIRYMENQKNIEFLGVISGVNEWGIYVEIVENKCVGIVKMKDIKYDHYIFDKKQYALIGQSTNRIYQLGDEVTVKVKNTDLDRKYLNFTLIQ